MAVRYAPPLEPRSSFVSRLEPVKPRCHADELTFFSIHRVIFPVVKRRMFMSGSLGKLSYLCAEVPSIKLGITGMCEKQCRISTWKAKLHGKEIS